MILSLLLTFTLFAQPGGQRLYYNLKSLKTVGGVVVAVHDTAWPIRMDIVTEKKDTFEVLLGPRFGMPWLPRAGDTVEIYGSIHNNIIIAGRVNDKTLKKKLTLRDQNGFPVWRGHGFKQRRGRHGRR